MRHKKRGRTLGRNSSHRRAMLRNLASSLFLTEWDFEEEINVPYDDPPKYPGRVTTTLHKAKEVRSLVEKCVTIAIKSLPAERAAEEFSSPADKQTDTAGREAWRKSDQWQQWAEARAPVVSARRRVLRMLGNKMAVKVLFEQIAPRFEDEGRTSGYTRVLRLAAPRLGDAGTRAILEFSGKSDRTSESLEQPQISDDELDDDQEAAAEETTDDDQQAAAEETTDDDQQEAAEETADDDQQEDANDGEATEAAPEEDSSDDDKE